MTPAELLISPPVAACLYLLLAYGIYRLGGALAAPGEDLPGKGQPYACGEDLLPPEAQLNYHAFFQLALMFALLHLAALILGTLPAGRSASQLALLYVLGIVMAVLVLTKGGEA